jgi:hypothetical protein
MTITRKARKKEIEKQIGQANASQPVIQTKTQIQRRIGGKRKIIYKCRLNGDGRGVLLEDAARPYPDRLGLEFGP